MPRGLIPEAFVQQSELVVWSEGMEHRYSHDSCAICHEAFSTTAPDICRVLGCAHVFHAKCIDLWFIKATFCPLCKSDLKLTHMSTSSQPMLRRSSQNSSHRSLGSGSQSLSSLRSGQILVGHSNSDPALLRVLQENPHATGVIYRGSPPRTPEDRHYRSTPSLTISFSDRSLPVMGSSRSSRSVGALSSSSSGAALPVVQEASDEARAADDSQRSQSSHPSSPLTVTANSIRNPEISEMLVEIETLHPEINEMLHEIESLRHQVVVGGHDESTATLVVPAQEQHVVVVGGHGESTATLVVAAPEQHARLLGCTAVADSLQSTVTSVPTHGPPPAPLSRAPQGGLFRSSSMPMPMPRPPPAPAAPPPAAAAPRGERRMSISGGAVCRVPAQPSTIARPAVAAHTLATASSSSSQSQTALPVLSSMQIPGRAAPPPRVALAPQPHSGPDFAHGHVASVAAATPAAVQPVACGYVRFAPTTSTVVAAPPYGGLSRASLPRS